MGILTQPEISALLATAARCPDCRRTGQLLAVALAVGFMAGVALCVVAVYWVMTLD